MSCKTPKKQKYPSRKSANKSLRYQPKLRYGGSAPYRCGDHWHLGRGSWQVIEDLLEEARS